MSTKVTLSAKTSLAAWCNAFIYWKRGVVGLVVVLKFHGGTKRNETGTCEVHPIPKEFAHVSQPEATKYKTVVSAILGLVPKDQNICRFKVHTRSVKIGLRGVVRFGDLQSWGFMDISPIQCLSTHCFYLFIIAQSPQH